MSGPWCVDQFFQNDATAGINGVWSAGPTDVWAVGSRGIATLGVGSPDGFILHWDGCAWTESSFTVSAGLNDVWGANADDVWAVGDRGTAVHWDGGAWSSVDTGTSGMFAAVSGSGGADVWAVGLTGAFHWNGTAWAISPGIPDSTQGFYSFGGDVWAVAPNDVWMAMAGVASGSIAHFDGTGWTISQVGPRPDYLLSGIWSNGATTWVVGEGELILQGSAGVWTPFPGPSSGGSSVGFRNVMALGDDVYAVGEVLAHSSGGAAFQTDPDETNARATTASG